jgi:hypothetical protein
LKNVAEEDAAERKVWGMDAFTEDWNESQFWVLFSFSLFSLNLNLGFERHVIERVETRMRKAADEKIVFRRNSYAFSRGIASRCG